MIRNVKRKYFELWGEEESQNVILKWFVIGLSFITLALTVALVIAGSRSPTLIAIGEQDTKVLRVKEPNESVLRSELERMVREYTITHYTWNSVTIEAAHAKAARYVADKFRKAFVKANEEQVRFVKEKKVSQRVYIAEAPVIDPKKLTARVKLDRIYQIEGLMGSVPITLDLAYTYGDRTDENPEGIYITDEKLIQRAEGI